MHGDRKDNRIYSVFFPSEPRDFPFRRSVRTLLRALHIFSTGTLLAGYIFNQPTTILEPWLWASVITGLLLLATDVHASMAVLFELRGLAIIIKTGLLVLALVLVEIRMQLLLTILLIGVFSSHMPKRYRHKVFLIDKRIIPDDRNG